MTNPVILWRESCGYGGLTWSQTYVRLDRDNATRGDLAVGNPGTIVQFGRGTSPEGWAIRGNNVGSMGVRATTLGFSGAIDTNAMTNNKIGVAFAYNQGGNVGGSILCEFWDDDANGDGSFVNPLLHLSIETLNDGRICARNGTGAVFGSRGTIIGTSTFIMPVGLNAANGNYTHIEVVQPVIHATNGSVQVYADGALVLNLTGVQTRHSPSQGSGKIGYVQVVADNGRLACDMILHDCSGSGRIGDKRVTYQPASVAGTYTAGTATGAGTRLGCVSEQAADGDTTYILEDDTALPKKVSFTCTALPAGAVSVDEVTEHVIVRKSDASANTGRYGMISGATEVDNGADLATPSGYSFVTQSNPAPGHQVDPNTSAAWSVVNCDAVEIVYERVA